VAARDPDDPEVLIPSKFAGAANELKGALLVNPYDIETTARHIEHTLAMPIAERRERWQAMMAALRANDITVWHRRLPERVAE
jgi:trehalose 6-phosphate synthase